MNLTAEELRDFVESELERRDSSISYFASQAPHPDGSKGIHRNAAYSALGAEGSNRVGTLLRLAKALGFDAERTYTLRSLGISERRRLHDEHG